MPPTLGDATRDQIRLDAVVRIVTAYLANHRTDDLPNLIASVDGALRKAARPPRPSAKRASRTTWQPVKNTWRPKEPDRQDGRIAEFASKDHDSPSSPPIASDVPLAPVPPTRVVDMDERTGVAAPDPELAAESLAAYGDPARPDLPTKPIVPIEESVTERYIVCLFDGKRLETMKRHIRQSYGMEWDEYLRYWRLPSSYPAASASYLERKSRIAKQTRFWEGRASSRGGRDARLGVRTPVEVNCGMAA